MRPTRNAALDAETLAFAARDDEPRTGGANRPPKSIAPPARLVRLADVQPERVDWLWDARIPRAMVTLIDGDPGLGKSTLALDLAARVSTGLPMPLSAAAPANAADVIVMTAEDHLAATVRPRLDAAGADVRRVHAITAMPKPKDPDAAPTLEPGDIASLECAVLDHRAALVVIDPLMAYLPASIDSHRDQDVRGVFRVLAATAARTGAAIVIVRHLRKGAGPALYRGGGSIGITGAARSVLFVAADPQDDNVRVIASAKSNLAARAASVRWRLLDSGGVARVEWLDVAHGVTADELAAVPEVRQERDAEAPEPIEAAASALRELLTSGPKPSKEVVRDVHEMTGAAKRTIDRARAKLGIQAEKIGSAWFLSLPRKGAKCAEGYGGGAVGGRGAHNDEELQGESSCDEERHDEERHVSPTPVAALPAPLRQIGLHYPGDDASGREHKDGDLFGLFAGFANENHQ